MQPSSQHTNSKLPEKESDQMRELADSLPQLIWIRDGQGSPVFFNKAVYDYLGLNPEDTPKTDWIEIVHPGYRATLAEQWKKALATGEAFFVEYRLRKHTGEYRWHATRVVPQKDKNGIVQSWIGTSTDIHEQKTFAEELENNVQLRTQELQQAVENLTRTNRELEQFAYISSHDMQEPLRKIQTFTSMMLGKMDYDESTKKYLEKINNSASRMAQLIKDLLNYSTLSKAEVKFENVDLNIVLEKVKNDLEVTIKQKQAIVIGTRLPVLNVIPVQINQLIYNLLGNSLKFCEKRPFIEITAKKLTPAEAKKISELNPELSYYYLMFKDNGIGFSAEYKTQIFTIFQRLHDRQKYGGTGIGLAICKKIVENHRGFISAESEEGKGTSFHVYLPV